MLSSSQQAAPDRTSTDRTPIDRFIDDYLAEQRDLRVVERFARTDVSGRTGQWSELIPLSAPVLGEQYRFDVDLDACTGCKACVTACHSLNGLDDGESFRSTGLLVGRADADAGVGAAPPQQTITTTCHHCLDPGCLTGCPAEAYEKDPVTGIVRHLDDACIGCQYCTLTCPYDVPVYNDRLGIVRKCDMCADRLADGEAPACVQGCPTQAISIATFGPGDVIEDQLTPGAAPSALTKPTTRYHGRLVETANGDTAAAPDDALAAEPQHAHLPLVVMLVLSQWSIGIVAATALAAAAFDDGRQTLGALVALAMGAAAAGSSFAHLGQPLKAWRVVLGWSHSWLSREAITLPLYLALTAGAASAMAADVAAAELLLVGATAFGLLTVVSSIMIYVVTGRRWWRWAQTGPKFVATMALGGGSWLVLLASVDDDRVVGAVAAVVVIAALGIKLAVERSVLSAVDGDDERTASLLLGPLKPLTRARYLAAAAGLAGLLLGLGLAAFGVTGGGLAPMLTGAGLVALLVGELFERRLFFQACAPATMPGSHR